MSEKSSDLKSFVGFFLFFGIIIVFFECHFLQLFNASAADEPTLIALIRLHCALTEFGSYRQPKTRYKMESIDWSQTFDRAIAKWLDVARGKAFARVELACQLDAQIQITSNEIRHTSSYVDICHIIAQLTWLWSHVHVRDVALRVELSEKLVLCICKVGEYYVDRVIAQLTADGFGGQLPALMPQPLVNIVSLYI